MGGGPADRVRDLVAAARQVTVDHNRPDLTARLDRQLERLATVQPRVVVAGDFKQGKSTLINALVGADACPVEDDRSTAMVTEVVPVGGPVVGPVRGPATGDEASAEPLLVIGERAQPRPPAELAALISDPPPDVTERWWAARAVIPVPVPDQGELASPALPAFVDLPGVHGVSGAGVLEAALPGVAAVVFVSDAGAELSRVELAGIAAIVAAGLPAALVVPKIDFFPAWRKVAGLDREHLAGRGLDVPVLPVSSRLRRHAEAVADDEVEREAGFAPLEAWLSEVTGAAAGSSRAAIVDDVRLAIAGVRAALEARRDGTDEAGRTLADLEERATRLRVLTGDRARWRRVLADGIADLEPEGEHVLRDVLRGVQRDAEAAIEQSAPAGGWTRFSFWLAQRTPADVAAAFAELEVRAAHMSATVRDAFEDDEADAVALAPLRPPSLDPSELIDRTARLDEPHEPGKRTQRIRRSLRRVDTAGVLEGLAMITINPLSLAAGVLTSKRAVQGARTQALRDQRAAATDAVRQHVEEAEYVARREWRAAVRRLERELRDGYEALAESLARSADEAWRAARDAADGPDERDEVVRQLAELARLDEDAVAIGSGDG